MARPKVVIAGQGASNELRGAPAGFKIEQVTQMSSLIDAVLNHTPNVVVLPVDFPGLGGLRGIRNVRQLSPATKVVVLSRAGNPTEELEALRRGARGYSGPVTTDTLFKMVEKVQQGEVWAGRRTIGALLEEYQAAAERLLPAKILSSEDLHKLTSREQQILRLLSGGLSNKEIAVALRVSVSTIKAHLTRIFRKVGQTDRVRLALAATFGTLPAEESPQD